jgi:transcriptional regulator with XRE-family HTH domain
VNFGEYARGLRETKELSVRHVARQLGIEPSHLSRIETNERQASEEVLEALAGVLDVNPHVFLAMAGKVTNAFREVLQRYPGEIGALLEATTVRPSKQSILKAARTVRDGEW